MSVVGWNFRHQTPFVGVQLSPGGRRPRFSHLQLALLSGQRNVGGQLGRTQPLTQFSGNRVRPVAAIFYDLSGVTPDPL